MQKKAIPEFNKNIPIWLICALGLPLPLFSELLSIGGKSIAEYTYIFLIGYYVFSDDSVIGKIEKYKFIFLAVGLASAIINVYLFIWNDAQHPILNTAAKFISEWFMLISLLGIGKWCLNTRSKVSAYMVQRSFAFYILHFIWVVLFQYFMSLVCPNNTILLYIIPVITAYGATFASCEICVRIPFLCSVMGIKSINAKKQ